MLITYFILGILSIVVAISLLVSVIIEIDNITVILLSIFININIAFLIFYIILCLK